MPAPASRDTSTRYNSAMPPYRNETEERLPSPPPEDVLTPSHRAGNSLARRPYRVVDRPGPGGLGTAEWYLSPVVVAGGMSIASSLMLLHPYPCAHARRLERNASSAPRERTHQPGRSRAPVLGNTFQACMPGQARRTGIAYASTPSVHWRWGIELATRVPRSAYGSLARSDSPHFGAAVAAACGMRQCGTRPPARPATPGLLFVVSVGDAVGLVGYAGTGRVPRLIFPSLSEADAGLDTPRVARIGRCHLPCFAASPLQLPWERLFAAHLSLSRPDVRVGGNLAALDWHWARLHGVGMSAQVHRLVGIYPGPA